MTALRNRKEMLADSFRTRIRELVAAGKTVRQMSELTGKTELHCSRIAAQERNAVEKPVAPGHLTRELVRRRVWPRGGL